MPIEPVSPECSRFVALDEEVQWLADGVGGLVLLADDGGECRVVVGQG